MSSLDELLDRGATQERPRRRHGWWRWLRPLLAAAALAGALTLVAYGLGMALWYPLVFTAVLALLVLQRMVARLQAVALTGRHDPEPDPDQPDADGLELAVRRWRVKLTWERAGLWRSSRALQPSLTDLVDERLRQRRGISRREDPARARSVLGERLWAYLSQPNARTPAPRDLTALLDDLERI